MTFATFSRNFLDLLNRWIILEGLNFDLFRPTQRDFSYKNCWHITELQKSNILQNKVLSTKYDSLVCFY